MYLPEVFSGQAFLSPKVITKTAYEKPAFWAIFQVIDASLQNAMAHNRPVALRGHVTNASFKR